MDYRQIIWVGDSRKSIREFPVLVKQRTGRELARVQDGLDPVDWKPMPSVGLGVREIRVRLEGSFRVIYLAKFSEAVYVLHAFEKKTQQTAKRDIDLARNRFRTLIAERKLR